MVLAGALTPAAQHARAGSRPPAGVTATESAPASLHDPVVGVPSMPCVWPGGWWTDAVAGARLDGLTSFSGNAQRIASSCFQSEEAEFREAESLTPGHTVRKGQSQSLTLGSIRPRACALSLSMLRKEENVRGWKGRGLVSRVLGRRSVQRR